MQHKTMLAAATSLCAAALVGLSGVRALEAADTQTVEIRANDITAPLVPKELVRGDREFGGHGPRISCSVRVYVSPDQQRLLARVSFNAQETQPDHSTTRGEWEREIYTAPPGQRIVSFVGPASGPGSSLSAVTFVSRKAGFQILGPGEDFREFAKTLTDVVTTLVGTAGGAVGLSSADVERVRQVAADVKRGVGGLQFQGNFVHLNEPSNGGPVALFAIVGDTGGDDISNDDNPKDDTRIQSIAFKPLRVKLARR